MKCPIDGTELLMMERHGVEIDYCPDCRGVWLDRGELDKIIEKATPAVVLPDPDPTPVPADPPDLPGPITTDEPRTARREDYEDRRYKKPSRRARNRYDDDDDDYDDDDYRHAKRYKRKRRKSILSEIFDFD
ncbi:zf-TFIIB domain-containing protein [Aliiroseovarius sp. F47248L]|uniref:TFIIB-type zinc ribbon-containing protein n=1 Tax=Aliiroseovarius sp. F47248L TaxID=2926420 RepID=UPI001FF456CC|nr:zf-TFIIB domain-containing protein [Aliiroseovarius sp. F47248L]MCK0139404.1 zf-TFIIB domain-containing protein [Aliiroseovarius sp. F47248L]